MSCFTKEIYEIIPQDTYKIIRNCPKCGNKATFISTNNFRVNANGNQVDIWLIYQCEKCKHTYNLTIYERVKPAGIKSEEYKKFLANDSELAFQYGTHKSLFTKNKAEIDLDSVSYRLSTAKRELDEADDFILINNPSELKVRIDKVLSELLGISRNQVKILIKEKGICISENKASHSIQIHLNKCANHIGYDSESDEP